MILFLISFGGSYVTVKRNLIDLPKYFESQQAEERLLDRWGNHALQDANERFGFFMGDKKDQNWFLPMPPPNITGQLHLGHAMFLTLQDIKHRHLALEGHETLWLPGTDHAGLATHEKILEQLELNGQSADDLEAYWSTGWEWKEKFHGRITSQMKKMGISCHWDKERFTLDESYQSSARHAFKKCWEAGLIYHEEGQWYLDMKPLAKPLLEALGDGTLTINPEKSKNKMLNFFKKLEPWCISRQIPWGMAIPLKNHEGQWLLDEGEQTPGIPCSDTLDTWFLSSLWPFASLGWPEKTPDFEKFYPGQWMETGEDILFFWCAKMWMMGYFLTGQWPFKTIFLHGLIRDKKNQKMSKSLGNGIDPLEIMEQYGTDALRWHLAYRAEPGKDMKFNPEALRHDSSWLNKIWQAGRYLSQYRCEGAEWKCPDDLIQLRCEIAQLLREDRYPDACRLLQKAFRDDYCNGWLEENKEGIREGSEPIRHEAWSRFAFLLGMLHPFIPFLSTHLMDELHM